MAESKGKRTKKIKSNVQRCPYLKVTKKTTNKDSGEETTTEEFNDCYKTFCVAWDNDKKKCEYLQREADTEEEDEEEAAE